VIDRPKRWTRLTSLRDGGVFRLDLPPTGASHRLQGNAEC
jgi:hypothetical protein